MVHRETGNKERYAGEDQRQPHGTGQEEPGAG